MLRYLFPSRLFAAAGGRKSKPTRPQHKRTRLLLELLEDRLAPSVTPAHVYDFDVYDVDGNFADQFGGPALVSEGGTLLDGRYVFGPNQALRLSGALADTASYSVIITMELDTIGDDYNKIIDFAELSSDYGLYVVGGQLQLYPGDNGSGLIGANSDFQVALTYDGANREARVYLNGVLQQVYLGDDAVAAMPTTNVLTFFADDMETEGWEAGSGSVDRISIYNTVLSADDIANLDGGPPENTPPSITVHSNLIAVPEGTSVVNTGAWSDLDQDSVMLTASLGAIIQHANGTWSWSYTAVDGPEDSQVVTITATDSTGQSSFATFELAIANRAPNVQIGVLPSSPAPIHVYEFASDLTDQLGGSALVGNGGVVENGRYVFDANQGLQLNGALADPSSYSIILTMQLDSDTPFYKKIIDFANRTADAGVYIVGGYAALFPGAPGTSAISAGTDFQLAVTRDGTTGETRIYINGVLQQIYTGVVSNGAVATTNLLTFFEDDNISGGTEASGGAVERIVIYDRPLSDQAIQELAGNAPVEMPEIVVSEGATAQISGLWSDAGADEVTLAASVGVVVKNSDGSWSWSYHTGDGPQESQIVTITASDGDGASSATKFALVVQNAPPEFVALAASHPSTESPARDGYVTISGAFRDAGVLDTHTVTVDWGDGSPVEMLSSVDQAADSFSAGHHYTSGGIFTIRVTVTDSDGAAVTQTATAAVTGIRLVDGVLYVIGTDGKDQIDISLRKGKGPAILEVQTHLDMGKQSLGKQTTAFNLADVSTILVYAGAGDDRIVVDRDVLIDAFIFPGTGTNQVRGGISQPLDSTAVDLAMASSETDTWLDTAAAVDTAKKVKK